MSGLERNLTYPVRFDYTDRVYIINIYDILFFFSTMIPARIYLIYSNNKLPSHTEYCIHYIIMLLRTLSSCYNCHIVRSFKFARPAYTFCVASFDTLCINKIIPLLKFNIKKCFKCTRCYLWLTAYFDEHNLKVKRNSTLK